MARLERNPMSFLRNLSDQLSNYLPRENDGESDGDRMKRWSLTNWSPRSDIYEEGDELVFDVETPGFDKEDLDVSLQENRLLIEGKRTRETSEEDEDRNYFRTERQVGTFQRAFNLPDAVSHEEVEADYDDGLLQVRVPSPDQSTSDEQIEIS
ncbi:MAG: Hsp20/alpha crystallin family protein [bacterium]